MLEGKASSEAGWRARARRFAEIELLPNAAAIDRGDRNPPGIVARLAAEGFLGIGLPEGYGGRGGGAPESSAVIEELSRGSAAVATLVSVHLSVCARPIARFGSEAQKDRYLRPLAEGRWLGAFALTEPSAGSDAASITCRYTPEGDGYRLDGAKMFITNGAAADLLLAFARADRGPAAGRISAFLVPGRSPGLSAPQRLEKLGLHGSETNGLFFDGVTLPASALLGREGHGLSLALAALTAGRVGIASCALGVAQAAYEEVEREARRDPADWKRLATAQSYTRLAAARALVARAAGLPEETDAFVLAASAAKLASSQAAQWIAERAVDVAGPAGTLSDAAPGRLLRDARVFPIVEGTTEIQELILGRTLAAGPAGPAEPGARPRD